MQHSALIGEEAVKLFCNEQFQQQAAPRIQTFGWGAALPGSW
jgi:hypothetical protein